MRRESDNPWLVTDADICPTGLLPDVCWWCKAKLGQQHRSSCVACQRTVVIDATIRLVRRVPEDWKPDGIEHGMNRGGWCANNILYEFDDLADYAGGCLCNFFTGHYVREATDMDEKTFGVSVKHKRRRRPDESWDESMALIRRRAASSKKADQSHDWSKDMELPQCVNCGLSKISAHIWGDDDWTKEPIACPKHGQVPNTQD